MPQPNVGSIVRSSAVKCAEATLHGKNRGFSDLPDKTFAPDNLQIGLASLPILHAAPLPTFPPLPIFHAVKRINQGDQEAQRAVNHLSRKTPQICVKRIKGIKGINKSLRRAPPPLIPTPYLPSPPGRGAGGEGGRQLSPGLPTHGRTAPNGARFDSPGRSGAEPWVRCHRGAKAPTGRNSIGTSAVLEKESRPVGPSGNFSSHTQGCVRRGGLRPGLSNFAPFGAPLQRVGTETGCISWSFGSE